MCARQAAGARKGEDETHHSLQVEPTPALRSTRGDAAERPVGLSALHHLRRGSPRATPFWYHTVCTTRLAATVSSTSLLTSLGERQAMFGVNLKQTAPARPVVLLAGVPDPVSAC